MVDERLIYHLRPIFNIFLQNPALSKQKGKKCLNLPHSPLLEGGQRSCGGAKKSIHGHRIKKQL